MSRSRRRAIVALILLFAVAWGPGLQVVGGFWNPGLADSATIDRSPHRITADNSLLSGRARLLRLQADQLTGQQWRMSGRRHWIVGAIRPPDTERSWRMVVRFGFACDTVHPRIRAHLRALGAQLPQGVSLRVAGHTDSIGSSSFNQGLSERRATAVAQPLRLAGVRVVARGFGESLPLVPNTAPDGADSPDGRAVNRRVVVTRSDADGRRGPARTIEYEAGPVSDCTASRTR